MPPVVQPIEVHVGRGDVFVGVTVPGTPPVSLSGGVPGSGRFIGATLDTANFTYRPTTFDIQIQQDTGVVGYVIVTEDVRLEFTIGELVYENLRDLLIGAVGQGTYITLGGTVIPNTMSAVLVAPKRSGGGAYHQAMIYKAVFSEDRAFPFARQGDTRVRVVARAQSDMTRSQGDRQGFFHHNVISS